MGYNSVPSCHTCNVAKAAKLFESPRLALILEIAKSKSNNVLGLIRRFEKEAESEQFRIDLSTGLRAGKISLDEVSALIGGESPKEKIYTLARTLNLLDGTEIRSLKGNDVERLLDEEVMVNMGHDDGLMLTHDDDRTIVVRTCREYETALGNGFFPYTTIAIKIASDFDFPLAILRAVERAQIAEKSFIDHPRVGVTDLNFLSAEMGPWAPVDDPSLKMTTCAELLGKGEIKIKRVETGLIILEDDGGGVMLMELFRADISGYGTEEILVFRYDYATQGTFGAGCTGLLSRTSEKSIFTWNPFPHNEAE